MAGNDRESGAAPVQVRGTVLTVRRVDAYVAMTVVAPAIATRFRPGQFVDRGRRPAVGHAGAALVPHPRRAARPWRHGGVRVPTQGTWCAVAGGLPCPRRPRRGRPPGPPVPRAARPGLLPPAWRRLRGRPVVRAGLAAGG